MAVYVDDMNLIGIPGDIKLTAEQLKAEIEMKILGEY